MPKGISLHIGVNELDANQYGDEFRRLRGCVNDAEDMRRIAQSQGFESSLPLRDAEATASTVIAAIRGAAQQLVNGDLFLLTYSGHGSQIPDELNGDEGDGADETWVLHDRNLIDDELFALWAEFQPGVCILMVSDSCHSGTVFQAAFSLDAAASPPLSRLIPRQSRGEHFNRFRDVYNTIRSGLPPHGSIAIAASVILLAACRDDQETLDGPSNGQFTRRLKQVWDDGNFTGGHRDFRDRIAEMFSDGQQPQLKSLGNPNAAFETRRPFLI